MTIGQHCTRQHQYLAATVTVLSLLTADCVLVRVRVVVSPRRQQLTFSPPYTSYKTTYLLSARYSLNLPSLHAGIVETAHK